MDIQYIRQTMTVQVALTAFVLLVVATLLRPNIAALPFYLTYIGIASAVVAGLTFLTVKYMPVRPWHSSLVMAMVILISVPPMLVTGGLTSHFALVLPLLPIIGMLICSVVVGWAIFAALSALFTVIWWSPDLLPAYQAETLATDIDIVFLKWLLLVSLTGATLLHKLFSTLAHDAEQQATTQSDTSHEVMSHHDILVHVDETLSHGRFGWLTMFMIEVDNLGTIKHLYGQEKSQMCEQSIARRLSHSVRCHRDAVGHLGKHRFLVSMADVDQSRAHSIADKMRSNIMQLAAELEVDVPLTVTIGYCSLPKHALHSAEQLNEGAEKALQAGIAAGRNQTVGAEQSLVTKNALSTAS